jgi:hypothetical protein
MALALGALGVLATGAAHLEEYTANGFSTVPTIGTLFLLNFAAATVIGVGLLLPLERLLKQLGALYRSLLAIAGITLGATSLIALWISESSSLFGFTDHGYRPAIVASIAAEAVAVVALSCFLVLTYAHAPGRGVRANQPRTT